ncbi:hypothetical protein GW17_00056314 [Ensete ventricosum]|nr:hypothetical protein GW17_00056314 [Ensete ventricosum]
MPAIYISLRLDPATTTKTKPEALGLRFTFGEAKFEQIQIDQSSSASFRCPNDMTRRSFYASRKKTAGVRGAIRRLDIPSTHRLLHTSEAPVTNSDLGLQAEDRTAR